MSNEARVGIFVVVVFAVFVVLSMKIGELSFNKKKTYPVTMVFSTVEGLKVSSPLELAGVEVGKVSGITLNKDFTAVVRAEINEDVKLPVDSSATIATKGVLGDKIIQITPGVSRSYLEPGGNLARTTVPPSLETLLTQVGELAQNLTELSESLNQSLGDGQAMREIVTNIRDLSEVASTLARENKDDLEAIISNTHRITDEFVTVSENLASSSRDLGEITRTVNSGQGTLGRLVKDEELYASLVTFTEQASELLEKMNGDSSLGLLLSDTSLYEDLSKTAENLRTITDAMASGKGTIGRLMTDDEIYDEMKDALASANKAMKGIEEQTPITVMGTVLGIVW
ncbi:MAG TPA: MlaD family protein [Deltaproteobacteria bacterium]|nr:MlaD family protein [Deltaproteobacteria bacterium]HOM28049.1 MlaD family protein [Deltaproteobacteria bacterium]HPP80380.1 MlaD family protein [Deltaproteobacteria bacterium]